MTGMPVFTLRFLGKVVRISYTVFSAEGRSHRAYKYVSRDQFEFGKKVFISQSDRLLYHTIGFSARCEQDITRKGKTI